MTLELLESKYLLLPNLGLIVNPEIVKDLDALRPSGLNEKELIRCLLQEIDDETIAANLSSVGNIALNIKGLKPIVKKNEKRKLDTSQFSVVDYIDAIDHVPQL